MDTKLSPGMLERAAMVIRARQQQLKEQEDQIVEQGLSANGAGQQPQPQPMPQQGPQMGAGQPPMPGAGGMPPQPMQGGQMPGQPMPQQQFTRPMPVDPRAAQMRQMQLAQMLRARQGQ